MKLYSAYYSSQDPFGIFDGVEAVHDPRQLNEPGVLVLWGGEDISPSIYNQEPVHARAGSKPSMRDMTEINLAKAAIKKGIPIVGVCRGAQLMCALSGGTLYQHIIGNHHSAHVIKTTDGDEMTTSSCHHQALNLKNTDGHVLAYDPVAVKAFTDKEELDNVIIPEVVFFKKNKTLAIQGHPEWMSPKSQFVQWCSKQIKELLWESHTPHTI